MEREFEQVAEPVLTLYPEDMEQEETGIKKAEPVQEKKEPEVVLSPKEQKMMILPRPLILAIPIWF